ncbi:hypothetical protein [Pseudogemmobacter humi]|uniref:Uncharacterized protein n=1 Tax=Pseudogemmobacter humi TaxID=2483812 RepID=A0A3P5XA28_9RHOB|nr:hypothetical protein [Pseudogemmobacter humi]VDC31402.1 hypothetical protein XINFAN_02874 [Pseudogemmobacter humi]
MSFMDQIDALGAEIIAAVEAEALADLADLAMRRSRAAADRIIDDALARLAAEYRLHDEDARVRDMIAFYTPPEDLAAIPVAPGRGPMHRVPNYLLLPGGTRARQGAHWRRADQLSIMCRQEWERHRTKCQRTCKEVPFSSPFTPGQIQMGLHYQALVERHEAAGMKCASVEVRAAASPGGGNGGGFIEALLSEARELDMIRRRIGDGVALPVRRGAGRRPITDRALVDAVCLAGKDLTAVLREHGWANDARARAALRRALAAALDRMSGYQDRPEGPQRPRSDIVSRVGVVAEYAPADRPGRSLLAIPKKGD